MTEFIAVISTITIASITFVGGYLLGKSNAKIEVLKDQLKN